MNEEIKKDQEERSEAEARQKTDKDKEAAEETKQAAEEEAAEKKSGKKKNGKAKNSKSKADQKKLEEELKKAQDEIAALKDSRLRLMAEYENFKRRSQKEKDRMYGDALIDVTKAWLPVLDNLERAAASAGKLDDSSDAEAAKQVAEGIDMIRKQAAETLEKIGVKEIEALNKPFDPELHEAVMRVDSEEDGEEKVVEVFAKGYIFEDRVIRHSVVKVAN